jgi:hypothetical protein
VGDAEMLTVTEAHGDALDEALADTDTPLADPHSVELGDAEAHIVLDAHCVMLAVAVLLLEDVCVEDSVAVAHTVGTRDTLDVALPVEVPLLEDVRVEDDVELEVELDVELLVGLAHAEKVGHDVALDVVVPLLDVVCVEDTVDVCVPLAVALLVVVAQKVADWLGDALWHALPQKDALALLDRHKLGLGDADSDPLLDRHCEELGVEDSVALLDKHKLRLTELVVDPLKDCSRVPLPVGDALTLTARLPLPLPHALVVDVALAVALNVSEELEHRVEEALSERLADPLTDEARLLVTRCVPLMLLRDDGDAKEEAALDRDACGVGSERVGDDEMLTVTDRQEDADCDALLDALSALAVTHCDELAVDDSEKEGDPVEEPDTLEHTLCETHGEGVPDVVELCDTLKLCVFVALKDTLTLELALAEGLALKHSVADGVTLEVVLKLCVRVRLADREPSGVTLVVALAHTEAEGDELRKDAVALAESDGDSVLEALGLALSVSGSQFSTVPAKPLHLSITHCGHPYWLAEGNVEEDADPDADTDADRLALVLEDTVLAASAFGIALVLPLPDELQVATDDAVESSINCVST